MSAPAATGRGRTGAPDSPDSPDGAPDGAGSPGTDGTFRAEQRPWSAALRSWLRVHRFWLVAGTIAATIAVVLFALAGRGQSRAALAVDNPAPEGAMAVASVLGRHGITVRPTDSLGATLEALRADPGSTVLLYDPGNLLPPTGVRELPRAAAAVVAVSPGPLALKALTSEITLAGTPALSEGTVDAGCAAPNAVAAERINAPADGGLGRVLYRGPVVCFPDPAAGTAGSPAGLLAATADGRTTVLGAPAVLSNASAAEAGNAALVLRTLGAHNTLVWYTPSLADVPASDSPASLSELTPGWVAPAASWLMMVGVLAMLWRGRRDGPLVAEPLPVLVKASETVAGRARLYQQAGAVATAADKLRAGTLVRLARHLRLDPGAGRTAVAAAAADRSTLPAARVQDILSARPGTEKALLAWAAELDALEKEVTGP
ncbi:DUF4350 domain-containing protein [Pseudarthrobacter sp. P1]|uniref:DUF4350 domain-containing protein n=1 Tax=Pseudarthrobacter sp. P1 TaxID=3418418 RepID=UPI003CEECC43